jgi:hypothetical protein
MDPRGLLQASSEDDMAPNPTRTAPAKGGQKQYLAPGMTPSLTVPTQEFTTKQQVSSPGILNKQGMLTKRSDVRKNNWKPRYFTLTKVLPPQHFPAAARTHWPAARAPLSRRDRPRCVHPTGRMC